MGTTTELRLSQPPTVSEEEAKLLSAVKLAYGRRDEKLALPAV
jgi:hypothetical protein